MDITQEPHGSLLLLAPVGRLDSNTAQHLDAVLTRDGAAASGIVIDCAGLDYVSSAGLRVLLKAAKAGRRDGRALSLCALRPNVREVFDISGFTAIFTLHPDRAAALAAAAPSTA